MLRLVHGTVDLDSGDAVLAGVATRLTGQERALLRYLVERTSRSVTREELLVEVLGHPATSLSRAADTAMARLRRKIEPDPARPVHLVSVFGTGYRFEPAPSAELVAERVGLPVERTPFVGREPLVARVLAALADRPLVTLTGPAGVGKTRVAAAVAAAAERERVVFVPLRSATTGVEAIGRIGEALGLSAEDLRTAAATVAAITRRLGSAATLLVLDNAEQLDPTFREAVDAWTPAGGRSAVLVTSRRPLGAAHEQVVRVDGLSAAEALRLWQDRAAAAGAPVDPDADEDPDLPVLLAELDHLPLAIELAAARSRALSPGALLGRLHDRLKILSRGARDGDRRDASLAAALDASWDLLTPAEQEVLARCSVFVDPFSDEAAAAVAGPEARSALVALERASLCSRTPRGTELLRSVAAWAEDKAVAAGIREDAELRHGRYFVDLAGPEIPRTFAAVASLGRLLPELLVIPGRLERADPPTAVAAALVPVEWYQLRGPYEPWLAALEPAERAARASGDPRGWRLAKARVLTLRLRGAMPRALAELEEVLREAPPEGRGPLLCDLGTVLADLGKFADSDRALHEALSLLPEGPDRVDAEGALAASLGVMRDRVDAEVEERFRRCLDAAERGVVTDRAAVVTQGNFGAWLVTRGRLEEGERVLSDTLRRVEAAGSPRRMALALLNRGGVLYRLGRVAEGTADAERAVELLRREGHLRGLGWGLCNVASLRLAELDPEDALEILEDAEEVGRGIGDANLLHLVASYRAVALSRLGRIPEADASLARARETLAASRSDGILRVAEAHVDAVRTGDPAAAARVAALLASPPVGSGATFFLDLLRRWTSVPAPAGGP